MTAIRLRSRYCRLLVLATVLVALCYVSGLSATSIRFPSLPISKEATDFPWAQHRRADDFPESEEPKRPRPKLPVKPLKTKHKTRNGRPPRYGLGASSPRGRIPQKPVEDDEVPLLKRDVKARSQAEHDVVGVKDDTVTPT
jgi:hypothetical protein